MLISDPASDPVETTRAAGLRYVSDQSPGFRRVRAGRGFRYVDVSGRLLDGSRQARTQALAIPPAWTDVWICPVASGHIQATGRDARGRKQYIYHPDWRAARDETKYDRLLAFGARLPEIRRRIDADLSAGGATGPVSRSRVLATLARLLDQTAIRIGNECYARGNNSFGLTTLRSDHVDVTGSTLRFNFRGKGGKPLTLSIRDRRVSRMVTRLQDLPGQELFRYEDQNGQLHDISSGDLNDYLREVSGEPISAKMFRTWTAGVVVAEALVAISEAGSHDAKRSTNLAIDEAAKRLGNTRTVCRASYVHPGILEGYADGWLDEVWKRGFRSGAHRGLHPEEKALWAVLKYADRRKRISARKAS